MPFFKFLVHSPFYFFLSSLTGLPFDSSFFFLDYGMFHWAYWHSHVHALWHSLLVYQTHVNVDTYGARLYVIRFSNILTSVFSLYKFLELNLTLWWFRISRCSQALNPYINRMEFESRNHLGWAIGNRREPLFSRFGGTTWKPRAHREIALPKFIWSAFDLWYTHFFRAFQAWSWCILSAMSRGPNTSANGNLNDSQRETPRLCKMVLRINNP